MTDWRDRIETLLTVGVALGAIAVSFAIAAGAIGIFLGLVSRAFHWVA
jgi:hypothetical protein